jgi:hypothetical protein
LLQTASAREDFDFELGNFFAEGFEAEVFFVRRGVASPHLRQSKFSTLTGGSLQRELKLGFFFLRGSSPHLRGKVFDFDRWESPEGIEAGFFLSSWFFASPPGKSFRL